MVLFTILSDLFRVKVAAEFVRRWILPRYVDEGELTEQVAARRRAQVVHFAQELCPKETRHQWFLPLLMASRLSGFISLSGLPSQSTAEVRGQLRDLQRHCKERLEGIEASAR